ncbi:lysozyme [Salmonella enterica subsp. enterica serovar Enteritidis str. EC20090641]|nr:lysozyme [Salmonella enterica subsp. enterica serovar Enteritidis]AKR14285.1 lysozyme [Salmonella enterica subsp. enterica serovar Enteritidis str. EC20090641]EJI06330.1 putative bacteriophage lysozyme [Salmonella enterica subsp. enterica serovar Enteritidis str. 607307-6]ELN25249.1 putative bacteriophage lysozyme [Salmonella enterica subsp. enterica serovar Enteritidis str. 629163]ELO79419.1 putative bacteriophage lysozyme [Salmonella enterica subsp. enterica serovar Enteritidis str. 33944]
MMFNWKTMFVGLLLVSLIVAGRLANHYRNNAITYKEQRDTVTHRLTLANATITDMTKRQRDVAALDEKYTKELADAKAENDALRDDVAAGRRRLYVNATCPQCRQVNPPPPPAWIMQPAPDWQTPLNGIISPSKSE